MKACVTATRHATIDMYMYTKSFTERKPLIYRDRVLMTNMYLLPLLDFDLQALAGKAIQSAVLRMQCLNTPETLAVHVSTISQEWDPAYCTNYACAQDVPWGNDGWFSDVIMKSGNSVYFREDVRYENEKTAVININPAVIEAMCCGQSFGLTVMDVKSVYYGEPEDMHERAMHFSAVGNTAPVLEIEYEDAIPVAPAQLEALYALPMAVEDEGSCAVQLSWDLPGAYADGSYLELYMSETEQDISHMDKVPKYMTPFVSALPRGTVIRGLKPHMAYFFAAVIRGRDGGGTPVYAKAQTLKLESIPTFERVISQVLPCSSQAFRAEGFTIGVTDDLVKINPLTGELYAFAGHTWNKGIFRDGNVCLPCARDEKLGFQLSVLLDAPAEKQFAISVSGALASTLSFGKLWCLPMKDGWFPDAVVPIADGAFAIPFAENKIEGQKQLTIFVDCVLPKAAPVGKQELFIHLAAGADEVTIPVVLDIAPVVLAPSEFWMDLNGYFFPPQLVGDLYGEPGTKEVEREYYRMCYMHNGTINILPYTHFGTVQKAYAPAIGMVDGEMRVTDWAEFDEHFGMYFDGSYLEEVIGERVPITHIQLPFHENWPMPIDAYYQVKVPDLPFPDNITYHHRHCTNPYDDFLPGYRAGIKSVLKDFIRHFEEKGWKDVQFQYFYNNKNFYKRDNSEKQAITESRLLAWLRENNTISDNHSGTSWWLLDEPHFPVDYEVLAYFGSILREAQAETGTGQQFKFRADLSAYNQMFDYFDGMLDTMYAGATYFNHRSDVLRRRQRLYNEEFWTYGTWNGIDGDNADVVRWFIDTFLHGSRGIIPWYNFGLDFNYEFADTLSIVYPGKRFGIAGAVASMRLKAARKAIEFIRYLEAMRKYLGYTNNHLKAYINSFVSVEGQVVKTDFLDAGTLEFGGDLNAIEALKKDMQRKLSAAYAMYM